MRTGRKTKLSAAAMITMVVAGLGTAAPAYASSPAAIKNSNSHLCLGWVQSSSKVGQYNCTGNADQEWYKVNPGGTFYHIENEDGVCLYAADTVNGSQIKADAAACSGTGNTIWDWGYDGGSTITGPYQPWVIGISAGSKSSGAQAVLWTANGAPNQNWTW
jgi:hypothetical protein